MKNSLIIIVSIFSILSLHPKCSISQTSEHKANYTSDVYPETPDDAYAPNQYDNKKVSPAYKFDSRSPSLKNNNLRKTNTASSIYTIQVNINPNNQNIIGDAANEPNIAINPNNANEIVIGWRQFDNILSNFRQAGWSYSSDVGQSWTFPGVLQPGIFRSDPVLDYDNAGVLIYNSLVPDTGGNFPCDIFKSTNGGVSWNSPLLIGGGDKQWMAIDKTGGQGDGNIYSSWTEDFSNCLPGFFTRSADNGNSFETCTIIDGSPFWGMEVVGPNGELYIAGANHINDTLVVAKSINANVPGSTIIWSQVTNVFMDGGIRSGFSVNPQGLLGQVNIDIDRSAGPGHGNVYILASMERTSNFDRADVMFSKSTDGGLTWSNPLLINDDNSVLNEQWFATLSVAPNGRLDAIWLDTREGNSPTDSSALYYSYSVDQGNTWSVNEKLSELFNPHAGYPNQQKMGDYFDMVSDNTGAHLAWSATFNGEEDVYYSFINPNLNTAIDAIAEQTNISIFPNPTENRIYLKGISSVADVEIYNSIGEIVFSNTINNSISEIDFSFHASGIYFLKLSSIEGSIIVRKIIKY